MHIQLGVDIKYHARSDMVHVFPLYASSGMQQCQDAFDEIILFFDKISSQHEENDITEVQLEKESISDMQGASSEERVETCFINNYQNAELESI